jgi:hypothetical protein
MWEDLGVLRVAALRPLPHFSFYRRTRFITAVQNCIVKIRRMRFPCIERDDHALVLEIDSYIVHAFDFHKRPAQLSHSLIVTLAFRGDFDGLQDGVIGALREERIGRIGIVWSRRIHDVRFFLN